MVKTLMMIFAFAAASGGGVSLCQSLYLEHGRSGRLLNAQYIGGEGISGVAGGFGYSLNGDYDLGLNVGRMSDEFGDLEYTSWAPYLSAILVRPTPEAPTGFEVQVGYESGTYSGADIDRYDWDMEATGLTWSGSIYGRIVDRSGNIYYPSLGVSRITADITITDAHGNKASSVVESTPVHIGVTELYKKEIILGIMLSLANGNSTWQAGVGYLF